MTWMRTSDWSILASESLSASIEPCVSALTTSGDLGLALADAFEQVLERTCAAWRSPARAGDASARAPRRFGGRRDRRPRPGSRHRRTAPSPGRGSRPGRRASPRARARPSGRRARARARRRCPTTTASPTCSVPRWTSTVATGPRPRSSFASMTTPRAGAVGFALSSWTSATEQDHLEQVVDARCVFLADTLTNEVVAAPLLGDDARTRRARGGRARGWRPPCRSC